MSASHEPAVEQQEHQPLPGAADAAAPTPNALSISLKVLDSRDQVLQTLHKDFDEIPLHALPQGESLQVLITLLLKASSPEEVGKIAFRFSKSIDLMRRALMVEQEVMLEEATQRTAAFHLISQLSASRMSTSKPPANLVEHLLKSGIDVHLRTVRDAMYGDQYLPMSVAFRNVTIRVQTLPPPLYQPAVPNLVSMAISAVVNKTYQGVAAPKYETLLTEASGNLHPKRLTLVLGAHRSGKSVLLHALAGKLRSGKSQTMTGQVFYNGYALSQIRPSNVCSVVEANDVHNAQFTVKEVLQFAYQLRGRDHVVTPGLQELDPHTADLVRLNRVELTLAMMGLHQVAESKVSMLSTGQLRCLSLAELILANQKIVLVDELASSLDVVSTLQIVQTLKLMARMFHMTIVLGCAAVSPEVFALADDVVGLFRGRVTFCGSTEHLREFLSTNNPAPSSPSPGTSVALSEVFLGSLEELQVPYSGSAYFKQASALIVPEEQHKHTASERFLLFNLAVYRRSRGEMFAIVYARQRALQASNLDRVYTRLVATTSYATLLGLLFFQIQTLASPFLVYMSIGLLVSYLGNSQKLFHSFVYANKLTTHKFLAERFYPPSTHVLVEACVETPVTLAEAALAGSVFYFLAGLSLTDGGAPYFWFIFAFCLYAVVCAQIVRLIDYSFDLSVAAPLATFYFTAFNFFFSGTVVTPQELPIVFRIIYYGVPASWLYTSLLQNEFLSAKYTATCASGCPNTPAGMCVAVSPPVPQNCGAYLLAIRQMPVEGAYKYAFVGMMLVMLFVTAWGSWAVLRISARGEHLQRQLSQRAGAAAAVEGAAAGTPKPARTTAEAAEATEAEEVADAPRPGLSLVFVDLSVTVVAAGQSVDLVSKVSGFALGGELTCMLGVSGAGKSTLLKVLAGRQHGGQRGGDVFINGVVLSRRAHSHLIGFVEAAPSLGSCSTVEEALRFAARMRLAVPMQSSVEDRLVQARRALNLGLIWPRTLETLKLYEAKIVALAMEYVCDTRILLMDEVTSALTSVEAVQVCVALRKAARTGARCVVAALHQPSDAVFECFDRVLLLARGGRVAFFGRREDLVPYFSAFPSMAHREGEQQSAATWALNASAVSKHEYNWVDVFEASPIAQANAAVTEELLAEGTAALDAPEAAVRQSIPLKRRLGLLVLRSLVEFWRLPAMLMRLTYSLLSSLIIAFTLFQVNLNSAAAVESLTVAVKCVVIFLGASNGSTAALWWTQRKPLMSREVNQGMYPAWMAAVAILAGEWIFIVLQVALYSLAFYFIVGLNLDAAWLVPYWVLVLLLTELVCSLLGYNFVAWWGLRGLDSLQVAFSVMSLFAGTTIPGNQIPNYLLGIFYASPYRWTMEGLVSSQYQFAEQVFCNPSGTLSTWSNATLLPAVCPGNSVPPVFMPSLGSWACCSPAGALPITVQNFALHGFTYPNNVTTPAQWGGQPNGYQFAWVGYDVVYLFGVWLLLQFAFVGGVRLRWAAG